MSRAVSTGRAAVLLACVAAAACSNSPPPATVPPIHVPPPDPLERLESALRARIDASGAEVGLYYRTLAEPPDSVLVDPDLRMHAASTMKVPVMMRLFLDHEEGVRSLDDEVEIVRTFRSIVDGSAFELPPTADSDTAFHGRVGGRATVRELIERMITRSSNLATNILIQEADPERVTALLRELGADSMEVFRGVEDLKAFEAGLSNTTTARDLGVVMRAVAASDRFGPGSRAAMLAVLERQHFTDHIPAGLPPGTRVANKTGWITGIDHDAAVVFPQDGPPYVLVVMIRGHPADGGGSGLAAALSRLVWEHHTR